MKQSWKFLSLVLRISQFLSFISYFYIVKDHSIFVPSLSFQNYIYNSFCNFATSFFLFVWLLVVLLFALCERVSEFVTAGASARLAANNSKNAKPKLGKIMQCNKSK